MISIMLVGISRKSYQKYKEFRQIPKTDFLNSNGRKKGTKEFVFRDRKNFSTTKPGAL